MVETWWRFHGGDFIKFDPDFQQLMDKRIEVDRKGLEPRSREIAVIRGCRQIGKTTYMKKLIRDLIFKDVDPRQVLYLSVDRFISTRRELRRAVDYFLSINLDVKPVYIVLDEITSLGDWGLELKYLADSGVTQKARVIVTGSSSEALRRESEKLPGRGLEGNEYNMRPLSFRRFIENTVSSFKGITENSELRHSLRLLEESDPPLLTLEASLEGILEGVAKLLPFKDELDFLLVHYLRCGGFPFAIDEYIKNYRKKSQDYFLPETVETFIRAVLSEVGKHGKSETTAKQLIREVIERYGSKYSFRNLARGLEVSDKTTGDYLDFLEKSYILSVMYAYSFERKSVKYRGSKKVYFQDPFLYYSMRQFLTGLNVNEIVSDSLQDEMTLGELVESVVSSHIIMNLETPYLQEKDTFSWFYYDTSGREIDNVVRVDQDFLGIEVKYRNNVSAGDVNKRPEISNYIIVSKEDYSTSKDVAVIPASIFLAMLDVSDHNL